MKYPDLHRKVMYFLEIYSPTSAPSEGGWGAIHNVFVETFLYMYEHYISFHS